LLFAGNRDEMKTRPWAPPLRHWPERPDVVAGLDRSAGGSWLGLNDHGVLAAVLNRVGSLGPAAGKRSRGELVLEALDHADAEAAAGQLAHLEPAAYRSFNLVLADNRDAFWLRNLGAEGPGHIEVFPLPNGLSMLTAYDRNDPRSPRTARHLPEFEAALPPSPDTDDWEDWQEILRSRDDDEPEASMTVVHASGFETVSSSLIALPAPTLTIAEETPKPQWLFAAGRPDRAEYLPVEL
jgi:hypothetical protein